MATREVPLIPLRAGADGSLRRNVGGPLKRPGQGREKGPGQGGPGFLRQISGFLETKGLFEPKSGFSSPKRGFSSRVRWPGADSRGTQRRPAKCDHERHGEALPEDMARGAQVIGAPPRIARGHARRSEVGGRRCSTSRAADSRSEGWQFESLCPHLSMTARTWHLLRKAVAHGLDSASCAEDSGASGHARGPAYPFKGGRRWQPPAECRRPSQTPRARPRKGARPRPPKGQLLQFFPATRRKKRRRLPPHFRHYPWQNPPLPLSMGSAWRPLQASVLNRSWRPPGAPRTPWTRGRSIAPALFLDLLLRQFGRAV